MKVNQIGLLICGMHRSGTSALARVCNLFGAALGTRISGSGPDNVKGFWENAPIMRLDNEMLASLGLRWDAVGSPSQFEAQETTLAPFAERARDLILAEFRESALFAFKDPRISRLLPFWLDVLRREGIEPRIIIAVRHPSEVAASLAHRNDLSMEQSYGLWLSHTIAAIGASRGAPACTVRYDALLENILGTMHEIARQLDFQWPVDGTAAAAEFLERALRHHVRDSIDPSTSAELDAAVARVFGELRTAPVTPVASIPSDLPASVLLRLNAE
jgi:hypothetical protein